MNRLATVVGLDLSLGSTGLCRLTQAGEAVTTTLPPPKMIRSAGGPTRLTWIRHRVAAFIEGGGAPDLVAVEGYAMGVKGSHAHAMGELGGLVRVWLWEHQIPYVEVPPTTLKKFSTGRGNADKSEMRLAVFKRWQFEAKSDDEIDAYALARAALALVTDTYETKGHAEALAKVQLHAEVNALAALGVSA